jgi:hypothetical protein
MTRPMFLRCFILGALGFCPMSATRAQVVRPAVRVEPGPLDGDRLKTSVDLVVKDVGALAPGQTYVFHIGGDQLSVVHTWVRVFLDLPRHVDELDETNNLVDKTL